MAVEHEGIRRRSRLRSSIHAEIRAGVEKDSTLYCHSVTETTNGQSIAVKPLVEKQDYNYVNTYSGKGVGRPKRLGYAHKGFVILVTWPDETEQVFSDMPGIRNAFALEGNVFLPAF